MKQIIYKKNVNLLINNKNNFLKKKLRPKILLFFFIFKFVPMQETLVQILNAYYLYLFIYNNNNNIYLINIM